MEWAKGEDEAGDQGSNKITCYIFSKVKSAQGAEKKRKNNHEIVQPDQGIDIQGQAEQAANHINKQQI